MVPSNSSPIISNNILTSTSGGAPGAGGIGGYNGQHGSGRNAGIGYRSTRALDGQPAEGGYSFGIYDVDTSDGLVPVVSNNTFIVGTSGSGGQQGQLNF